MPSTGRSKATPQANDKRPIMRFLILTTRIPGAISTKKSYYQQDYLRGILAKGKLPETVGMGGKRFDKSVKTQTD